jgi:hypothetical protein
MRWETCTGNNEEFVNVDKTYNRITHPPKGTVYKNNYFWQLEDWHGTKTPIENQQDPFHSPDVINANKLPEIEQPWIIGTPLDNQPKQEK